jgi:hypothetical protein
MSNMKRQLKIGIGLSQREPSTQKRPLLGKIRSIVLIFLLCGLHQASFAQLTAGVVQLDITPKIGGPMYGYSARGANVSQGVHDPLYAGVLVLDDGATKVAIVALDMGSIRKENTDNIKAMVRESSDIDNIVLVASHSHSSAANPWNKELERKISDAIVEADRHRITAKIGVGIGEVREGHNRIMIREDGSLFMFWQNRDRIPTSPVDYQLGVIRIEGSNGPIATLINFTCHPVVAGPGNLLISADYPGPMKQMVGEEIGGQVMFLQGAAGNINPFWDKTPPEQGAFEQIEKMGHAIAEEVIRVSRHIVDYDEKPRISFKNEVIPITSRLDTVPPERKLQAEINTILIGEELALATFPGEFFVEHGLSLKERSPYKYTFFLGYSNDQLYYFPTIQSTIKGGYGAGSATQVELGAGEYLVNRALINLLYQGNKVAKR